MLYMYTLATSNECFFSVAYIAASSTIIDGVVATRPVRLIVWLLLPSVGLQLITELQRLNSAEVLLMQTLLLRGRGKPNNALDTQQSTKD